MAAISGAHHANVNGQITSNGYNNTVGVHNGGLVGAGYRFIPGLKGFENDAREYISGTDHNEYYGVANGFYDAGTGCDSCHVQDTTQSNTRAGFKSGIATPNHSMSGFCSTCHGNFHSAGGAGTDADRTNNGVSGAFLRHPSDYVIPNRDEYALYTTYNPSAPVARPTVVASATAGVAPGTDMVMCLSCHVAHGSDQDYLLRFDYTAMTSGTDADQATAYAKGGCMACHSVKGVNPNPTP
jgi:predicted CXXCH cytochrome family protein